MIAVRLNHSIGFVVEHSFHRSIGIDLIPHARLRLKIEADLIRGLECCFRRTPRMKAHVIEAPLFAGLEERQPRFEIGWRVTGQREVTAVMRAAKDNRTAIENELISFGVKVAQTDGEVFALINLRSL